MFIRRLLLSSLILLSFLFTTAQTKEDAIKTANAMSYKNFFEHVKYFASDELKGRDIASEGFHKAAAYTAINYEEAGRHHLEITILSSKKFN
tara:strand:+ start:66 stop:341 length:276 start_codon:yes stop_codon:yes gene_type:complete